MNEEMIMRQYKRRSRITIAVLLIVILTVLCSSFSLATKLVLTAILFAVEIVILAVLMSRTTDPLLTDRLDPKLYYTVCTMLRTVPANGLTEILTAYYLFDYHAAYNLCVQKLSSHQYKKYEFDYKLYLARMYFDCGEVDKLREVCEEFYVAFEKSKKLRLIYGDLMRFYRSFCEEDYATCCDFYKQRMCEKAYATKKILKIQLDYGYAVARFKNGETEEAATVFTKIINEAPQLNFAYIARQYLEKIERGEDRGVCVTYTRDEQYRAPATVAQKPSPVKKRLWVFVLVAAVVALQVVQDLPRPPLDAVQAYDESVTEILCSLPVGDTNDLLCLCSNEHGNYTVAYLHAKGNERYQCKMACAGLRPTLCYAIQSPDSDLVLYCTVYSDVANIPADAVTYTPFTDNGATRYFIIISLEEKESWVYNGVWVESAE